MGTGGRRRTGKEIENTEKSILIDNLYWLDSKTGIFGKLFGITINPLSGQAGPVTSSF